MVGAWLCILGLKTYLDVFLENGVDGITLLHLTTTQFASCLGIQNQNHIQSLKSGLQLLKTVKVDYSHWEWSCHGVEQWLNNRCLGVISKVFKDNAVHGGVLFSFTNKSLHSFLANIQNPSCSADSMQTIQNLSPLILKSLWLSIKRAKKTGRAALYPNKYIEDWGEKEIEIWLKSINLGHLFDKFKHHGINGTSLVELKKRELLKTVTITEIQSIVLLRHIKFLRKCIKQDSDRAEEILQRNVTDVRLNLNLIPQKIKETQTTGVRKAAIRYENSLRSTTASSKLETHKEHSRQFPNRSAPSIPFELRDHHHHLASQEMIEEKQEREERNDRETLESKDATQRQKPVTGFVGRVARLF